MKKVVAVFCSVLLAACGSDKGASSDKSPAAVTSPETSVVAASSQSGVSASDFAPCAVCHMPTGAGVNGAFPPVRNRATAIAALDGGREYLITVAKYGMSGTIDVGGVRYVGVMPGQGSLLSDQALAAALNYSVFELVDGAKPALEPFSVEEIQALSAAPEKPDLATAGKLRQKLVDRHGDTWP